MKVLIVSHTVLCRTSNMGKTLLSFFQGFDVTETAQFYIHSEVPTDDSICRRYYNFSDRDALRSLLPFRQGGRRFGPSDIETGRTSSRTDDGLVGGVYQFGRRRSGAIYMARNALWRMTHWFHDDLRCWLDEFAPDVVFFASGDYAFLYRIALRIADHLKVPLVTACFDDYYINNKNTDLLGRLQHRSYMKTVRRTMARSSLIVCICGLMAEQYARLFHKRTEVLYTSVSAAAVHPHAGAERVSYIGNLGCLRYEQLIEMGRVLARLHQQLPALPEAIDVYSGERNREIISRLTEADGIRFHGAVPADQVLRVMEESAAVIHTESFDPKMRRRVQFSMSTKIAESLMYAPCLIAYGPEDVASMRYLSDCGGAYMITSPEGLEEGLKEVLCDGALREGIVEKARQTAERNHAEGIGTARLRGWLREVIDGTDRG